MRNVLNACTLLLLASSLFGQQTLVGPVTVTSPDPNASGAVAFNIGSSGCKLGTAGTVVLCPAANGQILASINAGAYSAVGLQGPMGPSGPQGPQGLAGPQGPQGIPGPNGTTDYAVLLSPSGTNWTQSFSRTELLNGNARVWADLSNASFVRITAQMGSKFGPIGDFLQLQYSPDRGATWNSTVLAQASISGSGARIGGWTALPAGFVPGEYLLRVVAVGGSGSQITLYAVHIQTK